MAKVIKASLARMASQPEPEKKPHPEVADALLEDEESGVGMEENTEEQPSAAAPEAEFQAAYDELIAAAEDEVLLMLKDAREESARLTGEAQVQADDIRASAHRDGYEAGLSEGRQEIFPLLERAQGDVDEVLRAAYAERDRLLSECEPQILELALDVAGKVLGYELDRQEDAFMSMVEHAMESIKADTHVTLHVSPTEYVRFFKSKDISLRSSSGQVTAQVVSDPALPNYGCLIETESGAVDASPPAQLEQMRRNLGMQEN